VFGAVDGSTNTTAVAYSVANVVPLMGMSVTQARQMCENAGKHLCTDEEWLGAANLQGEFYYLPGDLSNHPYNCSVDFGTYCNTPNYTNNHVCNTTKYSGGDSGCYSSEGVYHMVGNLVEFTNETISFSSLPGSTTWFMNNTGDLQTSTSNTDKYGGDVIWFSTSSSNNRAALRGGSWVSGGIDRTGPFFVNFQKSQTDTWFDYGFRCCLN
jgi:formylglycine-generating enzyme required for sulfatase activity